VFLSRTGLYCFGGGFVIALTVGLPLLTLLGFTCRCLLVRHQVLLLYC